MKRRSFDEQVFQIFLAVGNRTEINLEARVDQKYDAIRIWRRKNVDPTFFFAIMYFLNWLL